MSVQTDNIIQFLSPLVRAITEWFDTRSVTNKDQSAMNIQSTKMMEEQTKNHTSLSKLQEEQVKLQIENLRLQNQALEQKIERGGID